MKNFSYLLMLKSHFILLGTVLLVNNVSGQEIDSLKRPDIYKAQTALHQSFSKSNEDIVFLGNSITFWADWAELVPDQRFLKNRGIPGDNSFGVLERLDDILIGEPKQIFLMIGINDLAQGIPEELLLRNINRICDRIRKGSPKTKLIIQSILPTNHNFNKLKGHYKVQEKLQRVNLELKRISETKDVKFIDLYPYFIDDKGELKYAFSWDGVHLTVEGYKQWVKVLKLNDYLRNN